MNIFYIILTHFLGFALSIFLICFFRWLLINNMVQRVDWEKNYKSFEQANPTLDRYNNPKPFYKFMIIICIIFTLVNIIVLIINITTLLLKMAAK